MCEQKCTEHCYSGSEYDRVRFLESQIATLRAEFRQAKAEASAYKATLQNAEFAAKFPKSAYEWETYQPHRAHLLGKIQRQAEVIKKLQKVGWQPSFIIREVPYEDDAHLWLSSEPLVMSQRRVRNEPDLSLLD